MQAHKQILGSILAPNIRFLAPLFQRPYVWQRDENWRPLWEAVRDAAEHRLGPAQQGRPYFLGAIVLSNAQAPTLALGVFEIIDGQQRLTTLQILLAVIRDICTAAGAPGDANLFDTWIMNPSLIVPNVDDRYKVWPTNVDRDDFRRVMTAGSPFAVYHAYTAPAFAQGQNQPQGFSANDDPAVRQYLLQWPALTPEENTAAYRQLTKDQGKEATAHVNALLNVKRRIPHAYWYLHAEISEWLGQPSSPDFSNRIRAIYNALSQDIELIVIQLQDSDDAQQIFETLNALGAPLLPADLVKNYLFRAAERERIPTQPLYDRYWEVFDKQEAWRQDIRQGRLNRPRLDLFLQHYLTLITGEDILISDMFSFYQKWAQKQQALSPSDLLAHFRRYADVYWQFEHYPSDSREGLFFTRLAQLDNTTVLPLLLEVVLRYSQAHSLAQLRQILVDIESYLVRRLICGLSPKNYNRFFRDLVRTLSQADDFSGNAIRAALLSSSSDTSRWPNDAEFEQSWMRNPLYKMLPQLRTRMILEALERQQYSPLTGAVTIHRNPTIEHLLPQSWQAHWPLPTHAGPSQAAQEREDLLHSIGNLTLLSGPLNTIISNGPWAAKHQRILQHSPSNLNRSLPQVWDEDAIKQRSATLFDNALAIWPYPTTK